MFIFKSVETKLKSISIITILGFSILVYLIIFYSQTQEEYSQIKNKSNLLQNEIRSLEYISKEKATNKFFEKYITIIQNLKNLKNSMENLNLNTTSLDKLEKQLIISKTSYQTVLIRNKK